MGSDSLGASVGLGSLPSLASVVVGLVVGVDAAPDDSAPPEHPESSSIATTGTANRRTSYEMVAMTTTTYDVRRKFSRGSPQAGRP